MRTYAPAATEAVLARRPRGSVPRGRRDPPRGHPAREPDWRPFPEWLDPRIRGGLAARGIDQLYTHQAEAIEAARAGRDVVVVTPTASGKTLCYVLPALQAIADDPAARALFLFPTKALGQDQVAEFGELSRAAGLTISSATYDGDTPAPIRSAIRGAGQVVVTNPDMLHSAILPHHTKWFQLFEQLRVIVIDELHTYRGVFGSHVANVVRRLLRLCAHYGSHADHRLLLGDDREPAGARVHADRADRRCSWTGTGPRAASGTSSSSSRRSLDRATGARGSSMTVAHRWAMPFLRAGRQTVVFGRSRTAVEIMLSTLREALRQDLGPRSRVRGYRGGYLPTRARADRAGPARGRDPRRRRHERPRARRGHRPAGRLDPGRLSGLGRGDLAADRPGRAARRHERRRSWSRPARRSIATSSTTRSSSSTASRRRRGSTRTTSTS